MVRENDEHYKIDQEVCSPRDVCQMSWRLICFEVDNCLLSTERQVL